MLCLKFGRDGGYERRAEISTYGVAIPVLYFCILSIRFSTIAVDVGEAEEGERISIRIVAVKEAETCERCSTVPFIPFPLCPVDLGTASLSNIPLGTITSSTIIHVLTVLHSTIT